MDLQGRCLRFGAATIALALLLKLGAVHFSFPAAHALESSELLPLLIYLETGRVLPQKFPVSSNPTDPTEPTNIPTDPQMTTLPATTEPTAPPSQEALIFSKQDVSRIRMRYQCSYRPDLKKLLTSALSWDLQAEQPTILILHTHATESYTKQAGENYQESSRYRTKNPNYNMISIGKTLAHLLEQAGIRVIHDTALHDYPSYNGSYTASRKAAAAYLKKYPSIQLVLDLHRDAASDGNGGQFDPEVSVDGKTAAQLMLVVGTDENGLKHTQWQKNLALALKLCARLEQNTPGISRGVNLRADRFNQDLAPGMLLVEVGAAGNTHKEAQEAAKYLAQAIIDLANGANPAS